MTDSTTQQTSGGHHVTPLRTYLIVAGALYVLTLITVAVARIDFGAWNLVVAMTVAATKAVLVAMFFMHLFYDNKLYATFFVSALVVLATFIVLTMFDVVRRDEIYEEQAPPIREAARIYDDQGRPIKAGAHSEQSGEDHGGGAEADTASSSGGH